MSVQLHAKRHPVPGGDECLRTALLQLEITEEQVKGLLSLGGMERREPTLCELQRILRDVEMLVHPACQHSKVMLRVGSCPESVAVMIDFSSVRAAVLNLTLNAIEAAGRGGAVGLEVIEDDDEIRIEVIDNGPGPSDAIAGELCDAFATTKPEGVGIGLALAKQVAEDHGGRLSWERSGYETRFALILPKVTVTTVGAR
jgi:signal transduction histidine kinase